MRPMAARVICYQSSGRIGPLMSPIVQNRKHNRSVCALILRVERPSQERTRGFARLEAQYIQSHFLQNLLGTSLRRDRSTNFGLGGGASSIRKHALPALRRAIIDCRIAEVTGTQVLLNDFSVGSDSLVIELRASKLRTLFAGRTHELGDHDVGKTRGDQSRQARDPSER